MKKVLIIVFTVLVFCLIIITTSCSKKDSIIFISEGITIDTIKAKSGSVIILPVPTRQWFSFKGWSDEKGLVYESSYIVPEGGATLTALWEFPDIRGDWEIEESLNGMSSKYRFSNGYYNQYLMRENEKDWSVYPFDSPWNPNGGKSWKYSFDRDTGIFSYAMNGQTGSMKLDIFVENGQLKMIFENMKCVYIQPL